MSPNWQHIHESFALNGNSFSKEELKEVAYSFIKEGHDFEKPIGDFLLDWCSDKGYLEVFTSGSTGSPKKITLEKSHMVNSAMATGQYFNLKPNDTALLCLPATSIAGKMMLVRAMVLGLQLDYVVPSSQPLPKKRNYDFCAMVPLQAEKSLEQPQSIKILILGGAPVSKSLEKELRKKANHVFATYGMTETITHVAVRQISPKTDSNFKLLPFVEISQDDRQCLVLNAPRISDSLIITNDIVELINKSSIKWLGRYDNIINSGGIKLIPEQIEVKLSSLIPERFFVAGIPDDTLGQKLILVVEGDNINTKLILDTIKKETILDRYEIPKQIFSLDSFIETKSQKINRIMTLQLLEASIF